MVPTAVRRFCRGRRLLRSAAGVAPAPYPVASIRLPVELSLRESLQSPIRRSRLPQSFLEARSTYYGLCAPS